MNLSVLMSVYKKESPAFHRQCLNSLAAQTRMPDEVVIVEDGPLGEELQETLEAYKKHLPIVLVRLPANVGLGAALRAGMNECRGEYVARMDSDDICVSDRFRVQMNFLQQNPSVDVLGGTMAEFTEDCSDATRIRRLPVGGPALRRFAQSRNPMNHMTVVFRKASVVAAGNYESCQGFEDYHLWARMLMLGYRLHNMNDILVYARCGNGMHARRGGIAYLKHEVGLMLYFRELGFLGNIECAVKILLRAPCRLFPEFLRSLCYRFFLRDQLADSIAVSPSGWNDRAPAKHSGQGV
jgi:glycosyltransferase involved in cell wall biosynthesis